MIADRCDARPRIFITANRDRQTVGWSRHPSGRPTFAQSAGEALDAALSEIGYAPAVVIWSGRPPP